MSHAVKVNEAELHHITRIKEAEAHCTTNSCVLQQSHRESMLALECEVITEEGWRCHTFVEASVVALEACLPETHWAIMYPLQLFNWQCSTSHPVGNASCHTDAGYSWQRTDTSGNHPQWIGDASTSNGCQMAALFIWSGSICAKARGGSRTRQHPQGVTSSKTEGRSVAKPLRELQRGLF